MKKSNKNSQTPIERDMKNRNLTMHPLPGTFKSPNTDEGFSKRERAAIQIAGSVKTWPVNKVQANKKALEIVLLTDALFDKLDATKKGGI